jgi:hypothetical protein
MGEHSASRKDKKAKKDRKKMKKEKKDKGHKKRKCEGLDIGERPEKKVNRDGFGDSVEPLFDFQKKRLCEKVTINRLTDQEETKNSSTEADTDVDKLSSSTQQSTKKTLVPMTKVGR